jgi:thermostable 8-oxoguanine DNA glycosylase
LTKLTFVFRSGLKRSVVVKPWENNIGAILDLLEVRKYVAYMIDERTHGRSKILEICEWLQKWDQSLGETSRIIGYKRDEVNIGFTTEKRFSTQTPEQKSTSKFQKKDGPIKPFPARSKKVEQLPPVWPARGTDKAQRGRFLEILKNIPSYMRERLEELKVEQRNLNRPDFIWHYLLVSFSTMGNSRGYYGLIANQANYQEITYGVIKKLNPEDRLGHIQRVLLKAKVRMPDQKAKWLVENFNMIEKMGGLKKVKQAAFSSTGSRGKNHFLMQFAGIGDKYGRNIWMDVYHPDFRDHIAIDSRIKNITEKMGYYFRTYEQHEKFYLELALEANLEGWELDRLLYNYTEYFLEGLE